MLTVIIKRVNYALLLLAAMLLMACNGGSTPHNTNGQPDLIVLQPFDDFPDSLATAVAKGIKAKYKFEVKILPRVPMPEGNYFNNDPSVYDADNVLKVVKNMLPSGAFKIIGLVTKDLRHPPKETNETKEKKGKKGKKSSKRKKAPKYISANGYSTVNKHWGVVTISNLIGDFYGMYFESRLAKITNHEIGHMLGLQHCDKLRQCIMDSGAVYGSPEDTGTFCSPCRKLMEEFLWVK